MNHYYSGYISSRCIDGNNIPQRVQGIILLECAKRRGYGYVLGAAEYNIPGCYSVLRSQVRRACTSGDEHAGIICYSMHMLPEVDLAGQLLESLLSARKSMLFACEDAVVDSKESRREILELLSFSRFYSSTYDFH